MLSTNVNKVRMELLANLKAIGAKEGINHDNIILSHIFLPGLNPHARDFLQYKPGPIRTEPGVSGINSGLDYVREEFAIILWFKSPVYEQETPIDQEQLRRMNESYFKSSNITSELQNLCLNHSESPIEFIRMTEPVESTQFPGWANIETNFGVEYRLIGETRGKNSEITIPDC